MRGPAATESGPVLRRPTRTCLGLDRPRHSHTRWTRSRGLDTAVAESPEEAYQLRNALKAFARERTPLPFRWLAQARQSEPLPQLVMRKGAQGVIDGAGRTNAWVNMAFGIW
jgi:hypothetical protein